MCTAVSYHPHAHYFGRTLDLEHHYHECITITPRRFPLPFRHLATLCTHHAIIGTAYVQNGYPLYYDGMNEKGLCMAGLRFPVHCAYGAVTAGKENVASFELIPCVLGRCSDISEARAMLENLQITDTAFSKALPPSPLHWIIADTDSSITVEQTAEGLRIYDNPVGVLTNEPPFPMQLLRLAEFMQLSPTPPENRLAPTVELPPYSRGMGAMGLPGDSSSPSRFVRAVFCKTHSLSSNDEADSVAQFFHILQSVAQLRGCVSLGNGSYERTVYSSCCSAGHGIYYYTTYENSAVTAVDLHAENLDGEALISYPMLRMMQISRQNSTK
ncbi:MAG: choloylglycine hydrolase [Oscillospiraceae bacterium]|nr:choloylglycine hydrolase [Oscillospiraceae bacterium]